MKKEIVINEQISIGYMPYNENRWDLINIDTNKQKQLAIQYKELLDKRFGKIFNEIGNIEIIVCNEKMYSPKDYKQLIDIKDKYTCALKIDVVYTEDDTNMNDKENSLYYKHMLITNFVFKNLPAKWTRHEEYTYVDVLEYFHDPQDDYVFSPDEMKEWGLME